jgi:hypothetical protein
MPATQAKRGACVNDGTIVNPSLKELLNGVH